MPPNPATRPSGGGHQSPTGHTAVADPEEAVALGPSVTAVTVEVDGSSSGRGTIAGRDRSSR